MSEETARSAFCTACGAMLAPGDTRYCPSCGHPVAALPSQAHTADLSPPPRTTPGRPSPARRRSGHSARRWMVIVAAIGALAVATAAVLAFTRPNRQENAAGELFLDPAAGTGADPFTTGSAGTLPPPPAPAPAPAPAPSLPPATVRTPGSTAIQAISGATPGLYGGTLNNSSCNRDQLVVFLQQNPNRAAAWVAALNSDPGLRWAGGVSLRPTDIADYVAELTPLILRVDTRVTNHGFVDGSPTPRQTVLQAGTAVLVDRLGIPRVRCYCGNPLLPPHPISSRVRNRGNPWPNYTSSSVIVVQQSVTVINNFTVINVADNMTFQRPAGSTGTLDASTAPTPTATP